MSNDMCGEEAKCYRVEWTMEGYAGEYCMGACVDTLNEALEYAQQHIHSNYPNVSYDIFCITSFDKLPR